jgi:uncharacterized protein YbgA (DUF1722 family)/uncharacterized protein YbbK (DUF523 family)
MISFPLMELIIKHCNVHTVCPELAIGLGAPRKSMRLNLDGDIQRFIVTSTGEDLTDKMRDFCYDHVLSLDRYLYNGAIFKAKSPSCGVDDVKLFQGDRKMNYKTSGFYTKAFMNVMEFSSIETEGRLKNLIIREHFFTSIFTKALFESTTSMKDIVSFQTTNKYLLMMYDPELQKVLGRIVANHKHKDFSDVKDEYRTYLSKAMRNEPKEGNVVNTLQHIYGYFKTKVNAMEKSYFFDLLEKYRQEKLVIRDVLNVLRMWALHYHEKYLVSQTIFAPYPDELVVLMDTDNKYYQSKKEGN